MARMSPLRMLLSLLCTVLVTAQAGAHVHYCLDGIGQPVSVHAADFHAEPAHAGDEHHFESSHSDLVVFLGQEAPLKKSDGKFELPDPLAIANPAMAVPRAVPVAGPPAARAVVPVAAWHALLPPARGPPR